MQIGRGRVSSSTSGTTVTLNVPGMTEEPNFAIVRVSLATAEDTATPDVSYSIGMTDGTTSVSISMSESHAADPTETNYYSSSSYVAVMLDPDDGSIMAQLAINSFSTGSVEFEWDTNPSGNWIIEADLFVSTAVVVSKFQVPKDTDGTVGVEDLGSEPSVAFFLLNGLDFDDNPGTLARMSFGIAINDGTPTQGCFGYNSNNNQAKPALGAYGTDAGVAVSSFGATAQVIYDVTEFTTSGFTIRNTNASNRFEFIGYAALQLDGSPTQYLGWVDEPADTGTPYTTGVNSNFAMAIGTRLTAIPSGNNATNTPWSIGSATNLTQGCLAHHSEDDSNAANCSHMMSTALLHVPANGGFGVDDATSSVTARSSTSITLTAAENAAATTKVLLYAIESDALALPPVVGETAGAVAAGVHGFTNMVAGIALSVAAAVAGSTIVHGAIATATVSGVPGSTYVHSAAAGATVAGVPGCTMAHAAMADAVADGVAGATVVTGSGGPFGLSYRKVITLDGSTYVQGSSKTNFPAFVQFTDADIVGRCRSDMHDMAWTLDDGTTVIPHEVDDVDGNVISVWLLLPTFAASELEVHCYYAKADQTVTLENRSLVWDDYDLVMHMHAFSGHTTRTNSADNGGFPGAATVVGTLPANRAGVLADGADMVGSDSDYLDMGSSGDLTEVSQCSLQAMVRFDDFDNPDQRVFCKAVGTGTADHDLMLSTNHADHNFRCRFRINGTVQTLRLSHPGTLNLSAGVDYWVTCTFDGSAIRGYVNGITETIPITGLSGSISTRTAPLLIGATPNGSGGAAAGGAMDGMLSEVRICKVARDAEWAKTEYLLYTSPAALVSDVGEEELLGAAASIAATANATVAGVTGMTLAHAAFASATAAGVPGTAGFSVVAETANATAAGVAGATVTVSVETELECAQFAHIAAIGAQSPVSGTSIAPAPTTAWTSTKLAIAQWVTPIPHQYVGTDRDGNQQDVYIHVSAHDVSGISHVAFGCHESDVGSFVEVTERTVSPIHRIPTYWIKLSRESFSVAQMYGIDAIAYPNVGTPFVLPRLYLFVDMNNDLERPKYYVSFQTGSDSNSGTSGSPFATVAKAYAQCETDRGRPDDALIYLRGTDNRINGSTWPEAGTTSVDPNLSSDENWFYPVVLRDPADTGPVTIGAWSTPNTSPRVRALWLEGDRENDRYLQTPGITRNAAVTTVQHLVVGPHVDVVGPYTDPNVDPNSTGAGRAVIGDRWKVQHYYQCRIRQFGNGTSQSSLKSVVESRIERIGNDFYINPSEDTGYLVFDSDFVDCTNNAGKHGDLLQGKATGFVNVILESVRGFRTFAANGNTALLAVFTNSLDQRVNPVRRVAVVNTYMEGTGGLHSNQFESDEMTNFVWWNNTIMRQNTFIGNESDVVSDVSIRNSYFGGDDYAISVPSNGRFIVRNNEYGIDSQSAPASDTDATTGLDYTDAFENFDGNNFRPASDSPLDGATRAAIPITTPALLPADVVGTAWGPLPGIGAVASIAASVPVTAAIARVVVDGVSGTVVSSGIAAIADAVCAGVPGVFQSAYIQHGGIAIDAWEATPLQPPVGNPSSEFYTATAVVSWDHVQDEYIEGMGLWRVGVKAAHASGIDRVTFALQGPDDVSQWFAVMEPSYNTTTHVESYNAQVDLSTVPAAGKYILRAIAYPIDGTPSVVEDLRVYLDPAGELGQETRYVAPGGSGNGLTSGTPMGDIQTAIDDMTEPANGLVLLASGNNSLGSTLTNMVDNDECWVTVRPDTANGATRANCKITGYNLINVRKIKFEGLTLECRSGQSVTGGSNAGVLRGGGTDGVVSKIRDLWVHDCKVIGDGPEANVVGGFSRWFDTNYWGYVATTGTDNPLEDLRDNIASGAARSRTYLEVSNLVRACFFATFVRNFYCEQIGEDRFRNVRTMCNVWDNGPVDTASHDDIIQWDLRDHTYHAVVSGFYARRVGANADSSGTGVQGFFVDNVAASLNSTLNNVLLENVVFDQFCAPYVNVNKRSSTKVGGDHWIFRHVTATQMWQHVPHRQDERTAGTGFAPPYLPLTRLVMQNCFWMAMGWHGGSGGDNKPGLSGTPGTSPPRPELSVDSRLIHVHVLDQDMEGGTSPGWEEQLGPTNHGGVGTYITATHDRLTSTIPTPTLAQAFGAVLHDMPNGNLKPLAGGPLDGAWRSANVGPVTRILDRDVFGQPFHATTPSIGAIEINFGTVDGATANATAAGVPGSTIAHGAIAAAVAAGVPGEFAGVSTGAIADATAAGVHGSTLAHAGTAGAAAVAIPGATLAHAATAAAVVAAAPGSALVHGAVAIVVAAGFPGEFAGVSIAATANAVASGVPGGNAQVTAEIALVVAAGVPGATPLGAAQGQAEQSQRDEAAARMYLQAAGVDVRYYVGGTVPRIIRALVRRQPLSPYGIAENRVLAKVLVLYIARFEPDGIASPDPRADRVDVVIDGVEVACKVTSLREMRGKFWELEVIR